MKQKKSAVNLIRIIILISFVVFAQFLSVPKAFALQLLGSCTVSTEWPEPAWTYGVYGASTSTTGTCTPPVGTTSTVATIFMDDGGTASVNGNQIYSGDYNICTIKNATMNVSMTPGVGNSVSLVAVNCGLGGTQVRVDFNFYGQNTGWICVSTNNSSFTYYVNRSDGYVWGWNGSNCFGGQPSGQNYWVTGGNATCYNFSSSPGSTTLSGGGTLNFGAYWVQQVVNISVTSNLSTTWTLNGPAGSVSGSGTSQSYNGYQCGTYSVSNVPAKSGYTVQVSPGATNFGN